MSKADARAHARTLLERVGIADKAERYPAELSGGQQQRAAIARAVAGEPPLLLADEPTGNLDSQMAREVLEILEQLNSQGVTLVIVTHDSAIAARAQRNVHIVDGMASELEPTTALLRPSSPGPTHAA
jgi:putative ABC transport system ATP-binding protein